MQIAKAFFLLNPLLSMVISNFMTADQLYQIFCNHPIVCTDTRAIEAGCIFFALSGANFNGNQFAHEALQSGAAYAVVSDPQLVGEKFLYTEDTLLMLQGLAQAHRSNFQIPVVALTGSNGKTTTKELITAVLSQQYRVHATAGNFNNHIGVPLTILRMKEDTEIAVIEMGANHIGEIASLCEIAMPTHGLITNIGKAHLEGFGSVEGIQKGKGELFDYLKSHDGIAFVNADDDRVTHLAHSLGQKVTYSIHPNTLSDIIFEFITSSDQKGFTLVRENVQIKSSMFGKYNAINMVAAFTVGEHFAIERSKMIESLSAFTSHANRSEVISFEGCTIIKDAYNANPSSMEMSVRSFAEQFPGGWVILGDMKELGEESQPLHTHLIELILSLPLNRIILVGKEFASAYKAMDTQHSNFVLADSIEEIRNTWDWSQCKGKGLLLKGSRSMHLETLLEK